MKKTFSRALSVILTVLMLASVMPMAFAASPVALSASNVTEWPTVSYINGECMYFGQTVGEAVSLEGGIVKYNDVVVSGHFEHIDPSSFPTGSGTNRANIKFVPDDESAYIGFESKRSRYVKYDVIQVTPVFVDEANDPLIASEIEAGSTLSTSILSGGKVTNPYNAEEPKLLAAVWEWVYPNTIVNESGYYDAIIGPGGYEAIIKSVYVKIAGDVPTSSIDEYPSVSVTYNPNQKWGEVNLEGGKAVISDTTTEVPGTFAIADKWKDETPLTTHTAIDVVFTPNDETVALPLEFKLPVTVNPGVVKFVDESGNETIPEITIDRVLEVGDDLNGYLKPYLNASCSFNYEETEGYGEKIKPGTHEYTVKTIIDDPNYERYGTLTFKIVLNKEKVNAKVKNVVGGKQIYIEGGDTYHLNGNFDVKYFIDGKEAGIIKDIKLNEKFEIKQNKSGVYTYEIVYNGTEDDYYDITVITEAEDIKLQHQVKVVGQEAVTYKYGDTVTINAPAHEKPYYEFTGWVNESGITLSDEQRSAESINTTMPDNDIELEVTYKFNFSLFIKYIFDVICSWFAKIAAFITGAFAA